MDKQQRSNQEKDSKFHAMNFTGKTKSCRKAKQKFSEAATVTSDIVFCVSYYKLTLHMLQSKTFCKRSIGWALFGVNFRPLQEIEAIMGSGRIFDTGPFFTRLRCYFHTPN